MRIRYAIERGVLAVTVLLLAGRLYSADQRTIAGAQKTSEVGKLQQTLPYLTARLHSVRIQTQYRKRNYAITLSNAQKFFWQNKTTNHSMP